MTTHIIYAVNGSATANYSGSFQVTLCSGVYDIMVQGAAGGKGTAFSCGGQGAFEKATFKFTQTTILRVTVGEVGGSGGCTGGGGGASWVAVYSTESGLASRPLLEAGGGGGGSWSADGSKPGRHGRSATYTSLSGSSGASAGHNGSCTVSCSNSCVYSCSQTPAESGSGYGGSCGSGGGGGGGNISCCAGGGGGGGAGWLTSGGNGVGSRYAYGYGGSRCAGGSAGCDACSGFHGGNGGYGGGGGGGVCGGGGGGGYSGGGGGAGYPCRLGGGGGGSYISSSYCSSNGQGGLSSANANTYSFFSITCYLPGTLILTTKGEVAVEHLKIGDRLPTLSGQDVPIQWLGKQKFMGFFTTKEKSPVHFYAGSLGGGLPKRDLYVSAGHSMKLGEYLVDARLLVNGVTITQHQRAEQIEYYHIDLGEHHCICAEGSWAESYAECNENRDTFYNAAEFYESHPYHLTIASLEKCLPHVADQQDPRLSALFNELLAYIPHDRITSDADVHLLANGIRLDPYESNAQALQFRIPAGTDSLRLKSRTSSPCELGLPSDNRQLGFCLQRLSSHSEDGTFNLSLAPNHSKLLEGFHPAEGTAQRWTQGNALLPLTLLDGSTEEMILTLKGRSLPRYHLSTVETPEADFMPKLRLVH